MNKALFTFITALPFYGFVLTQAYCEAPFSPKKKIRNFSSLSKTPGALPPSALNGPQKTSVRSSGSSRVVLSLQGLQERAQGDKYMINRYTSQLQQDKKSNDKQAIGRDRSRLKSYQAELFQTEQSINKFVVDKSNQASHTINRAVAKFLANNPVQS
jgi:hypothetical protein